MKWYEFADKDDIRANDLYQTLLQAKMNSFGYWEEGWVKVPRKALNHLSRGVYNEDGTILWNGFDWIPVKDYEGANGRVYVRLLRDGEE